MKLRNFSLCSPGGALSVDVEDAPHVLGDAHRAVAVVEPAGAVVVSSENFKTKKCWPHKKGAARTIDGGAADELSEFVWCGRLGTPFARLAGFMCCFTSFFLLCLTIPVAWGKRRGLFFSSAGIGRGVS